MRTFLNSFAISRAGAVASVAANRRFRRALPVTIRLAMLGWGAVTIGLGAAATLSTGLGPGPFDVLIAGIANQTGLSFALSLWVAAGALATVAIILGRRPGPGTVLAPLIIGPVIQFSTDVMGSWSILGAGTSGGPVAVAVSFAVHLLGVALIGFGAGALITSGLGAGTGDLVAAATSSKLGRPVPLVRTGLELSWLGVGLMLG
ncbi:MAG: hypothetical protein ACR2QK_17680, partial [Acidimicrobiales bacterium]